MERLICALDISIYCNDKGLNRTNVLILFGYFLNLDWDLELDLD